MSRPAVLLIARAFPPYARSMGGAIRMLKLAQFLSAQGIKTHVLAARGLFHGTFGYDDILQRLQVHYVDDPLARLASGGASDSPAALIPRGSSLKRFMKSAILDLSVPDSGIFALPRMLAKARRLVEDEQITAVISSGPPHSDHLVGLRLKQQWPDLTWIVDYRDSWNGTSLFRKQFPPAQWLNALLERRVLRAADAVTLISEPMLKKARTISGFPCAENFHLIRNGFDPGLPVDRSRWRNDAGVLRIGYFGVIDDAPESYRNPNVLFDVISAPETNIHIHLFGSARIGDRWRQRLGSRLTEHGNLDHDEAVRRMADYDALMLLHTRDDGADEVVTGKVFEYIASGRPILAIGPDQMATNTMFGADAGYYSTPNDQDGIARRLTELAGLKRAGELPVRPEEYINAFSRERQYERFLPLLDV